MLDNSSSLSSIFREEKPSVIDNCARVNKNFFQDQWDISNVTWSLRGQTLNKICQYELSRSNLLILSNLDDDLIVIQNVQLEFRQVLRHYCTR